MGESMTEKLDRKLDQVKIKQTSPIRFKDEAINKIRKQNIDWDKKKDLFVPFDVSKDSHLKGLKLRVYKGSVSETHTNKVFYVQYWLDGKARKYRLGKVSQNFGVKECDEALRNIYKTHTDSKTGFWIKDPNKTKIDEKRIVNAKPDTTEAKGYTVNEVIEAYCGCKIHDEEEERGFSKDRKDGYRASKHAREYFRIMAGYNHRIDLVKFEDDEDGFGVVKFQSNKHLRVSKPRDMRDLFRKYPPGKGIIKDRVYYNRRKKQTYTIPASKNYSIYDSYLGKSLLHELTPGDIEQFVKDLSSADAKRTYVQVFVSLWIYAKKRGWLGTQHNIKNCPFIGGSVYVRKNETKTEDKYKRGVLSKSNFKLFWQCSEELSDKFPFKAELHQFMILTALRKTEALKMKKEFIKFNEGKIIIPKGISKTKYRDEELPITPELEVLLRNILDLGHRPGLSFYKMNDFPWLFATRKWKEDRYFNKEFRLSQATRLGGDENYIPALRSLMIEKSGDPDLLYAPKMLRKTYITLSQQKHKGRSEITQQMSRHGDINILNKHYNQPDLETKRGYASEVSKVFNFIQRRSA